MEALEIKKKLKKRKVVEVKKHVLIFPKLKK